MSRAVVDGTLCFRVDRPSLGISVHHALMGTTSYSTYFIDRLYLNLDNGRSV